MFLISALVAGLFLPVAYTCSLPTGTSFYTPIQRTILAPIVFQAKVLNTTTYLDRHATGQVFDACVRIAKIFKAPFEIPPELCFGSFGIEELCLTYVFEGSDYIFFVNEDFTARYDGFPLSAISVTDDNLSLVERGYCSADQSDDCGKWKKMLFQTMKWKIEQNFLFFFLPVTNVKILLLLKRIDSPHESPRIKLWKIMGVFCLHTPEHNL